MESEPPSFTSFGLFKQFLGATDSAVPCAIAMHVALTLDKVIKEQQGDNELGLQVTEINLSNLFVIITPTN